MTYTKIIFLRFGGLRLRKWDTFVTDLRHIYKRRTSCKIVNLPINVSIQSIKANYFCKKKFKRAAPILLRCSLLLFREEFFILLLSIRRKTFPLQSFIFLVLITSVKNTWQKDFNFIVNSIFFNCCYYFFNFLRGVNFICNAIDTISVLLGSCSYVINKVFDCYT